MTQAQHLTPDEIAAHAGSLRALARVLVRDAVAADDAVQETLVQALRHPPRREPTTEAWFRAVLRNTVRRDWRSTTRRHRREAHARAPASLESPQARLERLDMAQRLLDAVRGLPAVQREAIELRYFEELSPTRIAERLGVPLDTAKTRLKRARASLRGALDEDGLSRWPVAFALGFGFTRGELGLGASVGVVLGTAAALVALLVIGIAAVPWATGESSADAQAADPSLRSADAVAARPHAPTLVAGARDRAVAGGGGAPDPSATERARDPRVLRVRVLLVDDQGLERSVSEGRLLLDMVEGESASSERVEIVDGRFTLGVPEGHYGRVVAAKFGSLIAVAVDPGAKLEAPAEDEVVLRLRRLPDARVHVIDAETGEPISGVHWIRTGRPQSSRAHPGLERIGDMAVGASPIAITPRLEDVESYGVPYRIWAPGYGWERVGVRHSNTRAERVELRRSGDVRIHTRGPAVPKKTVVRIRATDRPGVSYFTQWPAVPDGAWTLRDLPDGAYVARVELGDWYRRTEVLGEVNFRVRPGVQTELELPYKAAKVRTPVSVRGTLRIADGWSVDPQLLGARFRREGTGPLSDTFLTPRKGMTPIPGEAMAWTLDAGALRPGRYTVGFPLFGYVIGVVVPEQGEAVLDLRIPPPVLVEVAVEGDVGGRAPFLKTLRWGAQPPTGWSGFVHRGATRKRAEDLIRFRVPAGPVRVRVTSEHWHGPDVVKDVAGRTDRITVTVRPTAVVRVQLMDGDEKLPYRWAWPFELKPVDHPGTMHQGDKEQGYLELATTEPGTYLLSIGPIPGYEALEPIRVEATLGVPETVVVPLTRR